MNTGTIVFLVLATFLALGKCQRHALINKLKRNANRIPSILPDTPGRPVNVTVGLSVNNIYLNSKRQELELDGWLELRWNLADEKLTWEPSDYGGIYDIRLNSQDLPKPDIELYNGRMDVHSDTLMILSNDGEVNYVPPVHTQSFCAFREYDEVISCLLRFGSWTYNCDVMPLTSLGIDLSYFNGGWQWTALKNTTARIERQQYPIGPEEYCSLDMNIVVKKQARPKKFWEIF